MSDREGFCQHVGLLGPKRLTGNVVVMTDSFPFPFVVDMVLVFWKAKSNLDFSKIKFALLFHIY